MGAPAAARVDDNFGHSAAVAGTALGLSVAPFAIGALIGMAILTGGVSLIAVGAAIAITGGAGLAGEMIGSTIEGPETGRIEIGSRNVAINKRAAAMTVLAKGHCSKDSGSPVPVATGAATVLINGQPAARIGEKMACSAVIREGSPNVFIGGPSKQVIVLTPEVPTLLHNAMLAMMWGGTAVGTLGVGLTYGAGAAIGSLAGGLGGSQLGGMGAREGAVALGYGATGQAVAETLGSLIGGGIGGGGGFKGGRAAGNNIWASPETTAMVRLRQGTSGGDPAAVAGANRVNNAVGRMPPEFQAEYAQAKAARWKREDGTDWWPPNNGAVGKPELTNLTKGTPVDRYGGETGAYLGRPADAASARALKEPPTGDPHRYVVDKDLPVEKAKIAPWFDEVGGGEQYRMVDLEKPLNAKGERQPLSVSDAKLQEMLKDAPQL